MRYGRKNQSVRQNVEDFYDHYGWVDQGSGKLGEDRSNRHEQDFSSYEAYHARSTDRTAALLANRRGALLLVGCGDLPESHARIAAGFDRVTCMDISARALAIAESKLGASASYQQESIVETTVQDDLFDAVFCAHVVYHIDKVEQEEAVRQLVRITKPGGRIVIIYANPHSPLMIPGAVKRAVMRRDRNGDAPPLYYYVHPLGWWRRFGVECNVSIMPWEVIGRRQSHALLWGDKMAAAFYSTASWFETRAPRAAVRLWQYTTVILDKS